MEQEFAELKKQVQALQKELSRVSGEQYRPELIRPQPGANTPRR